MTCRKNKEQILAALVASLKTLPAGSRECSAGLFHKGFPDTVQYFNAAFDSSKYIPGGCDNSAHDPKRGCIDCGAK